jgi:spoIIIJ-associated protein
MKDSEIIKNAEKILKNLLEHLAIKAESKVLMEVDDSDEKYLKLSMEGENLGYLIGYRGGTLNSLQLIFAQMLSSSVGEVIPVVVDVNGYRKRRSAYLESLALRAAREAKESGQDVELPPLNAFERRVVHLALQGEGGVSTESEGEGSERHIIVKIDKKKGK